jgi:NAD(P)H-hydrate epimerase
MDNPPAATREQIRELDRIAIQDYGIPGLVLMENAGRACARAAADMLDRLDGPDVVVLCGRGNNSGDGFVIARHLANWGAAVEILLLTPAGEVLKGEGEAAVNLRIALNMGIPLHQLEEPDRTAQAIRDRGEADLLVDALLGTGLTGEVREPYRSAIEAVNRCSCPVLAVDVPSGLDCDTGRPLGVAVRADRTVTFALSKVGFTEAGADAYTGRVEVAEISIPRAAIERIVGH